VSDGSTSHAFSFNVDVRPVGDVPVVGITSIERNEGSDTATMQWTVLDVDGEVNTDGQVLIDGNEVSSNHSCLETTPGAYQCVTLIPLGATSNPSQGGQTAQPSSEADDAAGVVVVWVQTILVLVIIVGSMLAGWLMWSSKQTAEASVTQASTEEEPQASGGGLLARAERLK
jgi:hypothetical protein